MLCTGALFAWSWSGHNEITLAALTLAINALVRTNAIVRLRLSAGQLRSRLWELPKDVCAQDISWTSLVGKLFYLEVPNSRVPHFTRDSWESAFSAYTKSVAFIKQRALASMQGFHDSFKDSPNRFEHLIDAVGDEIKWQQGEWNLGRALHALQDSYAIGHVQRDLGTETILDVHTWDKANRQPNPATGWPGHEALDNHFKDGSGHFTVDGQLAVNASVDLLVCVLGECNGSTPAGLWPAQLSRCLDPHFRTLLTRARGAA